VTVDTSTGPATLTVSFTVMDDLSGIAQVRIELESQSGAQVRTCSVMTAADADAPQTLGGACTITFPQHSEAGTWQIKLLRIVDAAGNQANLAASDLAAYATTLTMVSSTVDTSAPTLTAFSFTPTAVDTTAAAATVTVSATITDDLSGFVEAEFTFSDPSNTQLRTCLMSIPDGSTGVRAFTSTCTVKIPMYSRPGTWKVAQVYLFDEANNEIWLTTADLLGGGFSTTLAVTSTADLTPPVVTAFSFTPSVINAGSSSVMVTASITVTDDLAGIWETGVKFTSPSGSQSQICRLTPSEATPPAGLSGTCSVVIPRFSETGDWQVEWLYASDEVANTTLMGPADLAAAGFPSTLTLTSGAK
jgi:hypothetical protein